MDLRNKFLNKHGKTLPWLLRKTLNLALLMALSAGFASSLQNPQVSSVQDFASQYRSLAGANDVKTEEGLRQVLAKIFKTYPSARNLVSPNHLALAAEKLFGTASAVELQRIFEHDKARFNAAREAALKDSPARSNGKKFVISGLSASGIVTAMVAANAGYEVIGYEARGEYTRNIQWTGRQCIIDTLALINQDMSDRFFTQLVRPVPLEIDLVDNKPKELVKINAPRRGNPVLVPDAPTDMLNQETVMIMQTKKVEQFLMRELQKVPNVQIHVSQPMSPPTLAGDKYTVDGVGTPDLMVVAEGTGSKTRTTLGIPHAPTSPTRLQIAGEVMMERHGGLSFNEEHITNANGKPDTLLTSAISNAGSGVNWTVTDVPEHVNLEPAGVTRGTDEYKVKKQALVNKYYVNALARVLQKSESEIRGMTISGPIEKMPPTPFQLQQNMAKTAVYGSNTVALGDTVGNAHWNVGGGAHIAMVSHVRRLSELIFDLEIGRDRQEALQDYNEKVTADTLEWGRRGIIDFYPEYEPEVVKKNFDKAVTKWMNSSDPTKTPYQFLTERLAKIPKTWGMGSKMKCHAIFQ